MDCEIPCRSKDTEPLRRIDYEITYRLERGIKHFFFYKSVEPLFQNRETDDDT